MQRIVIKIGTSTVCDREGWSPRMDALIAQVARLRAAGKEIVLVSSGAIGLAIGRFKRQRSDELVQNQVSASVGQVQLMHEYMERFHGHGMEVGQLLLTYQDILDGKRRVVRDLLEQMLMQGVLPVINENDSVSTEEITFGDNDLLSAYIAQICCADLLILLSDVDGLLDKEGNVISEVSLLDEKITGLVNGGGDGKGGMKSKLLAAQAAAGSNVQTVIANGRAEGILTRILEGERVGTRFLLSAIPGVRK